MTMTLAEFRAAAIDCADFGGRIEASRKGAADS